MSCRVQITACTKILFLFALLLPLSLFSQTKLASTTELAQRAEVVAVGKVTSLVSEWNETRTMIRTRVTVAVQEYVKGATSDKLLTLYVPGGEVGGVGELYTHMPSFRPDEDVVVFAEKDKQNRYRVSNGLQGKLTVKRDKGTGALMVSEGRTLENLTNEVKQVVEAEIDKQ
ncbi:MAG: hypothetical protein HW389_3121 [Bacteroidetes bacterium]|nr:hypothetical protein [Bacteroidota bacterium]